MGMLYSTAMERVGNLFYEWRTRRAKILILGLDAAGKTTIMYRTKLNKMVTTVPTFMIFDVGVRLTRRMCVQDYFPGIDGLIYVVDSVDRERFLEAKEELHWILDAPELMEGLPVVVIANKQDLPGAESANKLADVLGLTTEKGVHPWRVLAASAVTGEGIREAMEELAEMVTEFQNK